MSSIQLALEKQMMVLQKIKTIGQLAATLLMASMFAGCGPTDRVTIEGKFFGASDRVVYLKEQAPSGRQTTIDSAMTDGKGRFSFSFKLRDSNPSFMNLTMGDNYVPLLVAPGEKVKVESLGNIYVNYRVEGSEGSQLLRELNLYSIRTLKTLDSLSVLYNQEMDPQRIRELGSEYSNAYISLKRNAIDFMVRHASSLAVVVPLYQPIFDRQYLFDAPNDIAYFKMVAQELGERYPTSPYVVSLKADVARIDNMFKRDSMIKASLEGPSANFIDLQMTDARGEQRRLSELTGQVVLLDFTTTTDLKAKSLNRELVETYNRLHDRGFEVFQVSVDPIKAQWLTSVMDARLPWISVNDLQGTASPALSNYNVTKLPANFLLDRQGNIVAKNLYGEELRKAVEALL